MQTKNTLIYLIFLLATITLPAQAPLDYDLQLEPLAIEGLDGIHSFAHAQYEGKWLLIGGRRDGIHPRQPFNAFPSSQNNTDIYLVSPTSNESWKASVDQLPTSLKEQLQATNFQYYQDGEMLILIGGYAYSASEGDHITFPHLIVVDIPGLVDAILNEGDISPHFQQLSSDNFAVTGGQMGKIDDTFFLIGGHRFDGRYNPMNHPTFIQTYTNSIRKFILMESNGTWSVENYEEIVDPIHLHRRDYNLLPQIFSDGSFGYTISSGVFQINQDLPFLYPVHIKSSGHEAISGFNQYLSNYHSAHAGMYNAFDNSMHHLFFGGISQYYYNGDVMVQDDLVPFVKTISHLSMDANSVLNEENLSIDMPEYLGASAEFIYNEDLPTAAPDIVDLSQITTDTFLLGYIVGGIKSEALNPFSFNSPGQTMANNIAYRVILMKRKPTSTKNANIEGYHDFTINVFPNPNNEGIFRIKTNTPEVGDIEIFLTDSTGKLLLNELLEEVPAGKNEIEVEMNEHVKGACYLTLMLNGRYAAQSSIIFQ